MLFNFDTLWDGVIIVIFKGSFLLHLFFLLVIIMATACMYHFSLFSFGSNHHFDVFTFLHNIIFNFYMKFITIRIWFCIFFNWFMVITLKFHNEILHFLMCDISLACKSSLLVLQVHRQGWVRNNSILTKQSNLCILLLQYKSRYALKPPLVYDRLSPVFQRP